MRWGFCLLQKLLTKLLFLRLFHLFYLGDPGGLDFLRFEVIPEAELAAHFEPANDI